MVQPKTFINYEVLKPVLLKLKSSDEDFQSSM
jgi:hypothetical protein